MFINSNDWATLIFRLTLALLVGCLLGFNRQQGGRPAGIRTFMLVSMGAALFVMIPLQAEGDSSYAAANALSRTIQGVATGVGFIGAGMILQQAHREHGKLEVRGLTTAATIWVAAGLGAALLAPIVIPVLTQVGKPLTKAAIKQGILEGIYKKSVKW